MASFGATLKLRLDKAEVDQGLDRVVTSAERMGGKLESSMARATKQTSKLGEALGQAVNQGVMRLADLAFDHVIEGFQKMAEDSVVIKGMVMGLKGLTSVPLSRIGEEIDKEFGGDGKEGYFSRKAADIGTASATAIRAAGGFSEGNIERGFENLVLAAGMLGSIATPFDQQQIGAGKALRIERESRQLDDLLREMRELNAKTPDPND